MSLFQNIRRHAAVARGDFGAMFRDVEIPPLPAAVSRLVAEVNHPEPDIERLAKLISSSPGLAAKVIKTVNSSFYSLRVPVDNVKRAVTLLGLDQVRALAIAFATMDALPTPATELFNPTIYWTDSLLRATVVRSLARKDHNDQLEQIFTVSLLSDLAIPVLLDSWLDYYLPVFTEWQVTDRSLALIEREHFKWDHAQAGAWILQSWGFPDELVCCLACHTLDWQAMLENGLEGTPVVPVAVASRFPSVARATPEKMQSFYHAARTWLDYDPQQLCAVLEEVRLAMTDVFDIFHLCDNSAAQCVEILTGMIENLAQMEES